MSSGNHPGKSASLPALYNAAQHTAIPFNRFSCIFSDMDHHYRTLLGTIPAIIYTLDEKGHFTYLSDSVDTLGYTRNELLGKHFSCIICQDDIHNVSRDDVLPKFSGVTTGAEKAPKLFDERRAFLRKTSDLTIRFIAHGRSGKQARGRLLVKGTVCSAGQYIPSIHDELKTRFCGTVGVISNLSAENDQPLKNAHSGNSFELLASAVAHGFSNVLTAIYGHVQLMEMQLENNNTCAENMLAIKEGVEKAVDLVNRISGMTRYTTSKSDRCHIADIMRDCMNEAFCGSLQSMKVCFSPDLWNILILPDQAHQIVRAMLHHARQIGESTDSEITIFARNVTEPLTHELPRTDCRYLEIGVEIPQSDPQKSITKGTIEATVPEKAVALALSYFYASKHGGLIIADNKKANTIRLLAYIPAGSIV